MAETAWFTSDDFADRVGDRFDVRLPDGQALALVLADVTVSDRPSGAGPGGESRQQFSLVFRGPTEPRLHQGLWELEHDALGAIALFLVPLAPDAEGPRYEAAFA